MWLCLSVVHSSCLSMTPSCGWSYPLSILSLNEGHLSCFQFLLIIKLLQTFINRYLGKYLGVPLLGHIIGVCLSFPKWLHHFKLPPAMFDSEQFLQNSIQRMAPHFLWSKISQALHLSFHIFLLATGEPVFFPVKCHCSSHELLGTVRLRPLTPDLLGASPHACFCLYHLPTGMFNFGY